MVNQWGPFDGNVPGFLAADASADARWPARFRCLPPDSAHTLVGRTVLRLDSMAAPHSSPLGVLSEELPWLRATRLSRRPLQTILR